MFVAPGPAERSGPHQFLRALSCAPSRAGARRVRLGSRRCPTRCPTAPPPTPRPVQDWRVLVAVFWVTSMVEGLGVSQIFAFLPALPARRWASPEAERLAFVGLFSSLIFVVGMPLVPLWGVWADKYSRKAVIVRSALVEAVVFAGGRPVPRAVAARRWRCCSSGSSSATRGDARRDPRRHARAPAGHGDRPVRRVGADRVRGRAGPRRASSSTAWAGRSPAVFALSAALSVVTALLVAFGSREVRPEVVPTGRDPRPRVRRGPGRARRPAVRRIFLIFGVVVPRDPDDAGRTSRSSSRGSPARARARVRDRAGGRHGRPRRRRSSRRSAACIGDRVGFRPVLIGGAGRRRAWSCCSCRSLRPSPSLALAGASCSACPPRP